MHLPSPRTYLAAILPPVLAAVLLTAPAALASTTTSTNWSGYALHQSGVSFRSASAEWRQPSVACSSTDTYSSFWVGIGGYRKASDALEQIGTELDCRANGTVSSSAWYELVPAASHAIRMSIASGNVLRASVTVLDHDVTVMLADLTTHRSFSRTIHDRTLDVTSAEWIAEAPSECAGSTSHCSVLPLADFGTAHFLKASATTATGVTRSLSDAPWTRTKITMGAAFITEATSGGGQVKTTATATPSSTIGAAGAFGVTYTSRSTSTSSPGSGGQPPTSGPGGGGAP